MGKLKIIIIVCGIIVVGTIGTIAIISSNKNSKTNNINSKTQNQILTTAPSKASTNESIAKSETENKASASSVASNNSASESSSNQSQEITNQVTATNTTSNISNSTSSNSTNNATTSKTSNNNSNISKNNNNNNNNNNVSSQTQSSNNSQKQSSATFSMATINKNCTLWDSTPKYTTYPLLKLKKGESIFVLTNDPDYNIQKGWVFVRTAFCAGYLPTTAFTKTSNINYRIEQVNQLCNLFSSPNKNSKIVPLNIGIYSGSLVYVANNSLLEGWSNVFVSSSTAMFKQGYILNKNLTIVPNSRVDES